MQINSINRSRVLPEESANEFPLSGSEIEKFKETFDRMSEQKKKNYLTAIQAHNAELVKKIKELDKSLNTEVDVLSKKIVSPSKRRNHIPKVGHLETEELTNKFQEMEKLKKQLEVKKTGIDSLQFLLMVKQEHQVKLNAIEKQIIELKPQIAGLKKIKLKSNTQENIVKKELLRVGEFNMFGDEIEELRKKVFQKNRTIKVKKEEFFDLYKKNRANKSVVVDELPKEGKEDNDPQLASFKLQYLQMGKKIQTLKTKKASLLKTIQAIPAPSEPRKILERLKQKYETLLKIQK